MPIYQNPSMTAINNGSAVIDNGSEAAKVKRTREQAYFNSYNFDANEALPYDDDEDDDKHQTNQSDRIKNNLSYQKSSSRRGLRAVQNGLVAKYHGLRMQNQRQTQRRSKVNSLSSKSSSTTPSSSSSTRSSSLSSSNSISRNNHTFFQHLDNCLIDKSNNKSKKVDVNLFSGITTSQKTDNANFSLPRPKMQYHSACKSVSMPLVVQAVSEATLNETKLISSNAVRPNSVKSSSQAQFTTKSRNDRQRFQIFTKSQSSDSPTFTADCPIVSTTKIETKMSMLQAKHKIKEGCGEGSSAESEKAEPGGRENSHYSTNKSGSSGYYSSNVCSTYSVEDHIYSEPVAVDGGLNKLNINSKSIQLTRQNRNRTAVTKTAVDNGSERALMSKNSQSREMNGNCSGQVGGIAAEDEETDQADVIQRKSIDEMSFNENLRLLETSIENLDKHLRNFCTIPTQARVAASPHTPLPQFLSSSEQRHIQHLPTIMEGHVPNNQPRSWTEDIADDSLMDIDLDSFLLSSDKYKRLGIKSRGIDNPSFMADEVEENNYKCAKYINSCPDDAYCVESDIIVSDISDCRDQDQLHFENTRELLEDVRDKIRLLSQCSLCVKKSLASQVFEEEMPKELEAMIKALKRELEIYLARINQHSESEIRQLCRGIVNNQKIMRMTKAFERRRSGLELGELKISHILATGEPFNKSQQVSSIRCVSDPNFKMKRKSLAEILPTDQFTLEGINAKSQKSITCKPHTHIEQSASQLSASTQLQRNLSFHEPVIHEIKSKVNNFTRINGLCDICVTGNIGSVIDPESAEPGGDKDSILECHRKKPSIWEMYYGTNRLSQSLLSAQRTTRPANNRHATMSYPSSRPESDFTLDLPRAEQLRIKMEKEKKFRKRCRYITAFLSLMFFLLTVMVVSLVLTRGKRMFGSMI